MADTIKIRRDIEANWNAVASTCILAEGEIGIITDKEPLQCKVGNGTTNWQNLPIQAWVGPGSITQLSGSIAEIITSIERLEDKVDKKTDLLQPLSSNNLINPELVVPGYLGIQGQDIDSETYCRTGNYIVISPNETYKILFTGISIHFRRVCYYDVNHQVISIEDSISQFTTPSNCKYVRVAWRADYEGNVGLFLSTVEQYDEYFKTLGLNPEGNSELYPEDSLSTKKDLLNVEENINQSLNEISETVEEGTEKLSFLRISESSNLINPEFIVSGYLSTTGGDYQSDSFYRTDNYIEVPPNESLKLLTQTGNVSLVFRRVSCYDETKGYLQNIDSTSQFTTPSNCKYVRVAWRASFGSEGVGLFRSSVEQYDEYFKTLSMLPEGEDLNFPNNVIVVKKDLTSIKEEIEEIKESIGNPGNLSVLKTGINFQIGDNRNYLLVTLDKNPTDYYAGNPVVNFIGWSYNGETNTASRDNVAPMHILGTTIGANHGYPINLATIVNHGKTNSDVGSEWHQGAYTYYLIRVVSENTLWFISENSGTSGDPSYQNLSTGIITQGNTEYTVSSNITNAQFYPAINNVIKKVYIDGVSEAVVDGNYTCNYVDIVEEYDVMCVDSTVEKLIQQSGSTQPPVYSGDAQVHIRNLYRVKINDDNLTCLVYETILPKEQIKFNNFMFTQEAFAKDLNVLSTLLWYLPNSIPSTLNFTTPSTWDASSNIYVNSSYWHDSNNPVNRVLVMGQDVSFALGFLKTCGVGKDLKDLTSQTFELRSGTGKIYPHGVDSVKVGTSINQSDIYTGILYKCFSKTLDLTGNRISYYHFDFDEGEYVFVDYRNPCVDTIILGNSFNGKTVCEVESRNVTLLSNVYNGGIDVIASPVTNETCYIVLVVK